jgi:hypothetical protein
MTFIAALALALGIVLCFGAPIWTLTKPFRWMEWRRQAGDVVDKKEESDRTGY